MSTRFEWDPDKAVRNKAKHGLSFATASLVFLDPLALIMQDRVVEGEQRWRIVGTVDGQKILVVVHTVVDSGDTEVIRIISARGAEPWEIADYEEQDGSI